MIFETKTHECFFCGRSLKDATILWDKSNPETIVTSIITDPEGKMIHGKTVLCECGVAQEFEPMTEETLNNFYSEENGISPYRKLYPVPTQSAGFHMANTINVIMGTMGQEIQQKGARILVVGSGDLQSIKMLEEAFKTARAYTHDPGIPESNYNFKDLPKDEKFDLIICNNTLEHVYNPIQFMRSLRLLCTLNTKLIFSVPDLLTTIATCPRSTWFSSAHIYHFTGDAMYHLLARSGYRLAFHTEVLEEIGHKIYIGFQLNPDNAGKEPYELNYIKPLTQKLKGLMVNHVQTLEQLYFLKTNILAEYSKLREGKSNNGTSGKH